MFDVIKNLLEKCPMTFLPALFLVLVERCIKEEVFTDTGMERQIKRLREIRAAENVDSKAQRSEAKPSFIEPNADRTNALPVANVAQRDTAPNKSQPESVTPLCSACRKFFDCYVLKPDIKCFEL